MRRQPAGAVAYDRPESWVRAGTVDIVTCHPVVDLEIDAAGHRLETLQAVAEDRLVTLRIGPPVRLVLANGPALPPGVILGVHLQARDMPRWSPQGMATFERDGVAELRVQDPGSYHVFIRLERPDEGAEPVSGGPELTIDVADRTGLQTFELSLSAATLQRIAELR